MLMGHYLSPKITWTGSKYAFLSIKKNSFSFRPMEICMTYPMENPFPMEISMPVLNGRPGWSCGAQTPERRPKSFFCQQRIVNVSLSTF